jgi:glycosyltransferase involved in cell wall biosynthesis
LHKLLTDGRQIMAFVIGAEEGEERLRSMANAMGLDARVTFLPEPRLISLGAGGEDVLILPQPPVQLALQTLGALAAGVVVVSAGPGLHDCLRDGETALMYRAGDVGQLAVQLDRLLQNRPLARRLADQGRAYVRDHHRVSTMVKRVVEVYGRVVAEHAARRKPTTAKA